MQSVKAEIVWRNKRFIGIPYKTPDYRTISFSDGTSLDLDRQRRALVFRDEQKQVVRELAIQSENIDHLYDLKGSIILSDGILVCRPKWSGGYEFKHDKLGPLAIDWIQFAQKDRKELFDLYAIASASAAGVLDLEVQKIILALELAMHHNCQ